MAIKTLRGGDATALHASNASSGALEHYPPQSGNAGELFAETTPWFFTMELVAGSRFSTT